jgi:hypothetical protein
MDPARMFMESLTLGPELEYSQGQKRTCPTVPLLVRLSSISEVSLRAKCVVTRPSSHTKIAGADRATDGGRVRIRSRRNRHGTRLLQ